MEAAKLIKPIVGYGSQILREQTVEANNTVPSRKVVQSLYDTINTIPTAVGLAAPQINSNLSMFIMKLNGINTVIINPRILKREGLKPSMEGCLSIPNMSGVVPNRNITLEVLFYDGHFNKHQMTLTGFNAIIWQHEYDHLNGILYTDRMDRHSIQKITEQLSKIENGNVKAYYDMIFLGPKQPINITKSPRIFPQLKSA